MHDYYKIVNDKEMRDFLRMNPIWYKELNRDPKAYENFKTTFEIAKKELTPSRLETVDKHLNTAKLLLKLISGFK